MISSLLLACGCAHMHHYSIGEMPGSNTKAERFEVKVSETGVDVGEATALARAISKSSSFDRAAKTTNDIWNAITFGPTTGGKVFSDTYPDVLAEQVRNACPNGTIVGLTSIRESNKYPVISGEIVRIIGYCRKNEGPKL